MVNMSKNSAMGGLLEPIENSAIRKSVLHEVCCTRCAARGLGVNEVLGYYSS